MNDPCEESHCLNISIGQFDKKALCVVHAKEKGFIETCKGCGKPLDMKKDPVCNYSSYFYHKEPCFQELKSELGVS